MRLDTSTVAELTRKAKTQAADDVIYFDEDLAGFGLRLRRAGGEKLNRTFVAQYRTKGGRTRRMRIGDVEKISANQARQAAKMILADAQLGHDPQGEKKDERAKAAHTLRSIAADYLEARQSELRPVSHKITTLYLTGAVYFGPLHATPVTEVTLADVAKRLTAIARTNGTVTAGRARAALSSMYRWAMGQGLLGERPINPVTGTNRPQDSTPRERVLDDAELAAIWRACENDDFGRITKLLILTGCRRNEIAQMRWSEVDFGERTLTLPAARVKNKRKHVAPLSDTALEILRTTPRRLGHDAVFGGWAGHGFTAWTKGRLALAQRLGDHVGPWRLHDLRRTAATRMADLGTFPHVIEAALNHRSGAKRGVAGTYNRSTYEAEVRAALVRWAERVAEIVARPRLLERA